MAESPSPVEVNIHSTITPISHEPIKQVNQSEWKYLSETELFNQLQTLIERRDMAYSIRQANIGDQIQKGIDRLTKILQEIETKRNVKHI